KVSISQGAAGKEAARSQRGRDFTEIKWHRVRIQTVNRANPRHVAIARPASEFAAIVMMEGIPATARDDCFDPLVEYPEEHRVVTAERMADDRDPLAVDLVVIGQHVDAAAMTDDARHCPRQKTIGVKVIIAQVAK